MCKYIKLQANNTSKSFWYSFKILLDIFSYNNVNVEYMWRRVQKYTLNKLHLFSKGILCSSACIINPLLIYYVQKFSN
jgi:hypothetical protein